MANKLIEEVSFTSDKIQDIMSYTQLAMLVKQQGSTLTDEDVMTGLRKKLNMTHSEIIAVARTLAK